jgi:hypothetical protein
MGGQPPTTEPKGGCPTPGVMRPTLINLGVALVNLDAYRDGLATSVWRWGCIGHPDWRQGGPWPPWNLNYLVGPPRGDLGLVRPSPCSSMGGWPTTGVVRLPTTNVF